MPGSERGDDAVGPGDAGAERDQREHVEAAGERANASRARRTASRPTARPASPARAATSCDSCRPRTWCEPDRWPPIASSEHRHGQREADPEAARHVDELGIGARLRAVDDHRLQRHAADRAGARAVLADLGMHRAGVDRALGHCGVAWRLRLGEIVRSGRRRTCRGSRPSRNSRCGRHARRDAWRCADRRSCRTPDPWPWRDPRGRAGCGASRRSPRRVVGKSVLLQVLEALRPSCDLRRAGRVYDGCAHRAVRSSGGRPLEGADLGPEDARRALT